jgi:WD40 repeat protein
MCSRMSTVLRMAFLLLAYFCGLGVNSTVSSSDKYKEPRKEEQVKSKPKSFVVDRDASLKSIAFANNGVLLAMSSDKITRYDVATGETDRVEKLAGAISDRCAPSIGDAEILLLKDDIDIISWNGKEEKVLYHHDCFIWRCSFSRDRSIAAIEDIQRQMLLYDLVKKKQIWKREVLDKRSQAAATVLALSADCRYCAAAYSMVSFTEQPLALFDCLNGKTIYTHRGTADSLYTVAFHPTHSKQFAIPGPRKTVGLCDLTNNPVLETELELPDRVMRLAYTPDGNTLIACCFNGKIVYIRDKKIVQLSNIPDPPDVIKQIAISPDGKRLAVLVQDMAMTIYLIHIPTAKD